MPAGSVRAHRRTRHLAAAGLGGVLVFTAMVVDLHLLMREAEPQHLSEFARTSYGWMWTTAALALAAGGACLALAVRPVLPGHSMLARVGVLLLWAACATVLLVAVFPTDTTPQPTTYQGWIHDTAVVPTVLFLDAAILLLTPDLLGHRELAGLGRASAGLGALALVASIVYAFMDFHHVSWVAAAQRAVVASGLCWMALVAFALVRMRPAETATPSTAVPAPDAR